MAYQNKDPYTYPNSNVLENKFGIRDFQLLEQIEAKIYYRKCFLAFPKRNFNYQHLKAIHKHLFGEVYDWAGQTRSVNISKSDGNGPGTLFAFISRIEPEINKLFKKLKTEPLSEYNKHDMCACISKYFNEINAVHPFREGNGRTNRAFCSELAKQYGYKIHWHRMDKKAYIKASIAGVLEVDYQPMEKLLYDVLEN